jgi:hypothetical protein
MTTYTIELNEAEVKAMEYIATDIEGWIINVVKHRAMQSMDRIYNEEVTRMTEDPTVVSIPADKEAVVLAANIKSAAVRHTESEALFEESN